MTDGEFTVSDQATIIVTNVAPIVSAGPGSTLVAGTNHLLQAGFADPGSLDAPWTYAVNWGDGTITNPATFVGGDKVSFPAEVRAAGEDR